MAQTDTTVITQNMDVWFDRVFLVEFFPELLHLLFAQTRNLPNKAGTGTIRFRRYNALSQKTTALNEGVTPVADAMTISTVEATVKQYGSFLEFTDVLDYTTMDPVVTEATMKQGKQAAETFDSLMRDELVTGTNVSYGGDATSRVTLAAGDVITTTLLDAAILALKNNDVPKIKSMINPSTFVGTQSVRAAYVSIVHPTIGAQIQALTGFIDVKDYGSQADVLPAEIGAYKDIRFIESTNAKIFEDAGASSEDVYPILIFGQEAYGRTQVSGKELETVRQMPTDPLKQRYHVGWKGTFVGKILDNRAIQRIEVTAS